MTEAKFNGCDKTKSWYIVSENPVGLREDNNNMSMLLFCFAGQFVLSSLTTRPSLFTTRLEGHKQGFKGPVSLW